MKDTIRKNGVTIRRPVLRPKHLVDCLRDPVHFEFFRRFAKCFHFERSVRFWKAVEVMKHIEDPKIRQAKIRSILNQFFAKVIFLFILINRKNEIIIKTFPELKKGNLKFNGPHRDHPSA